jgi:hypothetical protein
MRNQRGRTRLLCHPQQRFSHGPQVQVVVNTDDGARLLRWRADSSGNRFTFHRSERRHISASGCRRNVLTPRSSP